MDYGLRYSIYSLANYANRIVNNLDNCSLTFFAKDNLPYDRREILCAIQVSKALPKIDEKVLIVSHPAIHSAVEGIDFYEGKIHQFSKEEKELSAIAIYMDLMWLVGSMIDLIFDFYRRIVEKKISENSIIESIRILTVEVQNDQLYNTHPSKFVDKYRVFLNKRINDLKELKKLDDLSLNIEIRSIVESFKLGLEVNVKDKNLLTPLIQKDYSQLIDNIKKLLFIPSYFDVGAKENERYFHIYLLGVLEGRLNLYNLKSNKESGFGRYDICAFPINKNHPGLLIEVKSDNTGVNKALQQIHDNNYVNELRIEGVKEVLLLAINFGNKKISTVHEVVLL